MKNLINSLLFLKLNKNLNGNLKDSSSIDNEELIHYFSYLHSFGLIELLYKFRFSIPRLAKS